MTGASKLAATKGTERRGRPCASPFDHEVAPDANNGELYMFAWPMLVAEASDFCVDPIWVSSRIY